MSLSVVMVSAGFWPALGGAERQAMEQSAALAARGHRVTVLTRRLNHWPPRENFRGVDIRRLPVAGSGTIDSLLFVIGTWLWLMLHWTSWDAVHVHLAGSPALAAALAGRLLGRPVLVKLGGGRGIGELAASSRTWTGRLKLRVLAALKPRFLAVVPDLADEAQEFLGDVPMEVLPNGVDTTRYARVDRSRKSTLRQKLGWGLDSHIFIYTGRFSTEKRLPWFLRLWQQTAGRRSLAVLVGDGPEKDALREISSKSAGRILVLDPQEDLPDLYGASDVFFLPSSSEGLSNALLEAMSSGLTPLASRVGGNAQTIVDGETGLLFGAEDESALKDAITRLESESGLSERLGLAAHDAVRKQYALESVVERLEHLYRS